MSEKRSETSHFDMANRIYKQAGEQSLELYRLFRVYHPVYEISVNIETEYPDEHYHIIEKYMDKLICGYIGEDKELGEGIYIRTKDELFELLGIGQEAYEIAESFYRDLLAAGHFEEVPGEGIRGLRAARESVKLQKKMVSSTVKERKLFDQLSAKLMPEVFYELGKYACSRESVDDESALARGSVWLQPNETILNSGADLEQMLGNFSYISSERIKRGLPRGYQSMSISKDDPAEISFYPYYLAVFTDGREFEYRAYRIDNGKQIDWIGDQYRSAYYEKAVQLLSSLAGISEMNILNPLNRNFYIKVDAVPDADGGVFEDALTGNYEWHLQNWQIRDLLGLGPDRMYKKPVCMMIANHNIACLTSYESGKIIRIHKTEEQRQLLLASKSADEKERKALFEEYLGKTGERTIAAQVRLLSEAERARKEEAMQLYRQGQYAQAMELFDGLAMYDADCSFRLGVMNDFAYGTPEDVQQACFWYEVSSHQGNRIARFNLANYCLSGTGTEKNAQRAAALYAKSSKDEYANSMYKLARCYDKGQGVRENKKRALHWYRKAIKAGREKDYFDIAYLLHRGPEELRDYEEAYRYYLLSIAEGNAASCCNLGVMYANGEGVARDEEKAVEYYRMGSERGNAQAKYNLAWKYENGKSVPKDLQMALTLYEEAASMGHEGAQKKVKELQNAEKEEQS